MTEQSAELLTRIGNTISQIDGDLERLSRVVNTTAGVLPMAAQGAVAIWNQAVDLWRQLRELLEPMLANPGNYEALRTHAGVWDDSVGGLAAAIAGRADPSHTRVQRYWEGDAAEAYLATLPAQREALERIKTTFSDPASTMLEDMASAIESFWKTVGILLTAVVAATGVAIITGATGVGLPAALTVLVTVLAAAIGGITTAYQNLRRTADSHRSALSQKLHDNIGYPDGGWPRSTIGGGCGSRGVTVVMRQA